jgi:hypothetical protein
MGNCLVAPISGKLVVQPVELSAEVLLDLLDLALQTRFVASPIVDFQVEPDAWAIRLECPEAGSDHHQSPSRIVPMGVSW